MRDDALRCITTTINNDREAYHENTVVVNDDRKVSKVPTVNDVIHNRRFFILCTRKQRTGRLSYS